MLRFTCLVAVALLLVGCTFGKSFRAHRAKELVKGKTTEAEAEEILGEPLERFVQENKSTWVYLKGTHTKGWFHFILFSIEGTTQTETMRLRLDFVDGILQDYDFAMTFAPPGSPDVEVYHGIPEKRTKTPGSLPEY